MTQLLKGFGLVPKNPNLFLEKLMLINQPSSSTTLYLRCSMRLVRCLLLILTIPFICAQQSSGLWLDFKRKTKELRPNTATQRININGAVNGDDQSIVSREGERINAESTIALLQAMGEKHDPAIEVKVVLDNAGYNQAKITRSFANANNIELVFDLLTHPI